MTTILIAILFNTSGHMKILKQEFGNSSSCQRALGALIELENTKAASNIDLKKVKARCVPKD